MTLAESRMEKRMKIEGWLGEGVDLTELWLQVYFCKRTQLGGPESVRTLSFDGSLDDGHYVLLKAVEAVRMAQTDCHLEVSCYYQ